MFRKSAKRVEEETRFIEAIDEFSKIDHCLLCGKKINSACNSHVVPQFILKQIAEKKCVSYGHALHTIDISGLDKTTKVRHAYTFRLICNDCDNKTFQNYEKPKNIINFDNLDLDTQKKMLCEMAIKAHLSHISMKYRRMVAMDLSSEGRLGILEKNGEVVIAERIDIEEHEKYIKMLRKFHKSNKNPFVILFNKVLDYKTKLATQTIISFTHDLNGKPIFDPRFVSTENKIEYFYLMIIPFKHQTRVLFYVEKERIRYGQSLIEQFESLSEEDKLHFLFIALIIHDEQFYMSPSFAENIFNHDKKLVRLYVKTDWNTDNQSKIKDFKKYKNYLLKEFN